MVWLLMRGGLIGRVRSSVMVGICLIIIPFLIAPQLQKQPVAPPVVAMRDHFHYEVKDKTKTISDDTVYFVLTAALTPSAKRCDQYARGIGRLLNETAKLTKHHKIIVVEGNGKRKTCLDNFGVEVLYTDNNNARVEYGIKELLDVIAAANHLRMKDSDLIVKMTGRYYLDNDSYFIRTLQEIDLNQTRAIVKFGSFLAPVNHRMEDCITGLVMIPVSSVQGIPKHVFEKPKGPIEHKWAKVALMLPKDQVIAVQGIMGINITPGKDDNYFLV
jgi:hypothetical protein